MPLIKVINDTHHDGTTMTQKPISQACINNQSVILPHLTRLFPHAAQVLEVGSGTGQHAVYFSHHCPHIIWQTSDIAAHHSGIIAWLDDSSNNNCLPPLLLDVDKNDWPSKQYDVIYTANTLHIISLAQVELFFKGLVQSLVKGGQVIIYGPFKYEGQYTSESNARFNDFLQSSTPSQGIRDIETIIEFAQAQSLTLVEDNAMPANNQLLVFAYH